MPFVEVAESVGGVAMVEVAARRMSWSMSSRGAGVEDVAVEPWAQERAELAWAQWCRSSGEPERRCC